MPRRKRIYLPGFPYHLVQRGNNRQPCFLQREDFSAYLDLWREKSRWYGVEVHAYCLMTNHVHFIVSSEGDGAISNTMKVVGSRYAYWYNKQHGRSGTVWEGRHRSSLIDSEIYLLTCMRYVELNPVRANMVTRPSSYEWSSYSLNTTPGESWLSSHPVYLALGSDAVERTNAYRRLFGADLPADQIDLIRKAAHYSVPVGSDAFRRAIEKRFGVWLGHSKRGRPVKGEQRVVVNI